MSEQYPYGHMVHEYYVQREREIFRRRAAARAAVKTKTQLMRLRAEVRRKLRACFGPMPRRTPLNARITGTVRRRAYTIEKVIYESRPALPVTANLYLPRAARRPCPAVLGTCGHALPGKAYDLYQAFSANLARQGYVVLTYDPFSQGERLQYPRKEGRAWPRGCTQEHNMMGNQMSLLGDFFGAWRAWDGIRGLDYLLARPEVDAARVGLTGNSGGGTMTTWLTALDDRFTMAAPSCFVTQFIYNMENEEPQDCEQCPPGLMAAGLDMTDFFIAQIPRPTLLLSQELDFFDLRGLRGVYAELRRLYGILGRRGDVDLFIGPRLHGYYKENREAMYRFFNKHAGVRGKPRESARQRLETEATLNATPAGQVHRMRGARRVFDFTRERATRAARERKRLSGKALLDRIARRLVLPPRKAPPHYRAIRLIWSATEKRRVVSAMAVETEPGIQALVHVCGPMDGGRYFPKCTRATIFVPHLSVAQDMAKGLAPKAKPLFAVEVRGIGQLGARTCADSQFFNPYGSEYLYASHGLMLKEPYCGRRVHDLLAVLDLFADRGCRGVHLVGRGLGAIWATFAACLHPLVKRVTLHNALRSYHELTQVPVQSWPLSSLVPSVLKDFDLPDCHRLLRARKGLRLLRPWDSQMRPVRKRR